MHRMTILGGMMGLSIAAACGAAPTSNVAAPTPPAITPPEPVESAGEGWWTAGPSACPEGTALRGAAPPQGDEIWCELPDGDKHGPWTWFYDNGQRLSEGRYSHGAPDGLWTTWHENGNVKLQGRYEGGKEAGRWTAWHENGQPATDIGMRAGVRHGEWMWWYDTGRIAGRGRFVDGVPHGRWERWSESGDIAKVEVYDRDVLVESHAFRNGQPIATRQ